MRVTEERQFQIAGGAILIVIGFLIGFGIGIASATGLTDEPVVTTFTDSGRTCTQVVLGGAVDLDCDYPPGEERLRDLLQHSTTEP